MNQRPPTLLEINAKIRPADFPAGERDEVEHISVLLTSLASYLRRFHSSLTLFDFVRQHARTTNQRLVDSVDFQTKKLRISTPELQELTALGMEHQDWLTIVASEAAMSVYHFGETLKALRAQIGRATTIRDAMDRKQSKLADRLYNSNFPKAEMLRHALAHKAEHKKTFANFKRHQTQGSYLEWKLEDRTFTVTRFGEHLSIEVSGATEEKLIEIQTAMHRSLEPLLK